MQPTSQDKSRTSIQTSFAGGDLRLLRVELANISKACSYSDVVLITLAVDETCESRESAPVAHVRVYEILVSDACFCTGT